MIHSSRRNWIFLAPFLVLLFDFLGPMMALQKSFIAADFSVQHWPWAQYTYSALRAGLFPFWADAMVCGFPLAAEGQISAFYGLHRLLFALLPFWAAYSWSIVLHFTFGVLGFYAYARAVRISRAGAGFAVLIYAFGSGYAGCYYNTGSLRTLAWFPLILWFLEKMLTRRPMERIGLGALIALAVSQMWNAGFAQIALYAFGFAFCTALFNVRRRGGPETLVVYFLAVVLGTLLAAPQMVLSWELIGQSVRQGESIAFALWGSMPPTGPISILFPEWGNIQRISLYLGVPAVFAIAAFFVLPRTQKDYRHLWLFLFFLLLALGKFNPLYAALIKGLNLTFLRNPSKFLFFAATALAIVAARGLDAILIAIKRRKADRLIAPAAALVTLAVVLPGLCGLIWIALRPLWQSFSLKMAASVVAEKGASARPVGEYESFLTVFYERLGALFSYLQPNTLASIAWAVACAVVIVLAARRKISRGVFLVLFFAVAILDLHHYGWNLGTGFIGNTDKVVKTLPDARIAFLQKAASADPGAIAEFVLEPANEFLPPNRPMAYGLSHVGGYSPLLLKHYYDLTYDLGIVDGSLGRARFLEDAWLKNRGVLDLIGLKYLASDSKLTWNGFQEIGRVGKTVFYRNHQALPLACAWTNAKSIPEAAERLKYLKSPDYDPRAIAVVERDPGLPAVPDPAVFSIGQMEIEKPGRIRAIFVLPTAGIGMVRVAAYPGWKLRINGEAQPWFLVNHAFVGFRLDSGAHVVELDYIPTNYRVSLVVSALASLLVMAAAFGFLFKAKPL